LLAGRDRSRRRVALGTVAALVAAVVVFWVLDPRRTTGARALGDYEDQTVTQLTGDPAARLAYVVRHNVPVMFRHIATEAAFGHEMGPGLTELFGVAVIALGVALVRRRVLWGLLVSSTVGMMLLVLPEDAILPRYVLPVLPLLVYAGWRTVLWLNRLPRPWDWAGVVLLVVWVTPNVVRGVGLIIEQRADPFLSHYQDGRYPSLLNMAREIEETVDGDACVLAPVKTGRILSYFSRRRVVDSWELPLAAKLAAGGPLYVVEPRDAFVGEFFKRNGLKSGPRVSGPDGAGALALHLVVPASDSAE
ncbi:MAG: hypothetical protein ACREIT_11815, partial [Tepidisphaeraceae bacterium]